MGKRQEVEEKQTINRRNITMIILLKKTGRIKYIRKLNDDYGEDWIASNAIEGRSMINNE